MNDDEFGEFLADPSKWIDGDLTWEDDADHAPAYEFRAELQSDAAYPVFVRGSYNALVDKLTFVLIHRGAGRIYGLDMGSDHKNPDGSFVGELHKHRWCEQFRDREAYVPEDISAPASDPVAVWKQFCEEARIDHRGVLSMPMRQGELFDA